MLKRLSFWNTLSRILFLLLTPAFFRLFNFGFIWHSFYWGVISFVAMILFKQKKRKPILWLRFIMPVGFFASSRTLLILRLRNGAVEGLSFHPWFFSTELNTHYQHIWMYDTIGALLLGLLPEKRWACKQEAIKFRYI